MKYLDDLTILCAGQGITLWEGSIAMLRGWVDVTRGKFEQGLVEFRRGLAIHDRSPVGLRTAYYAALLAEGYLRKGDVDAASPWS